MYNKINVYCQEKRLVKQREGKCTWETLITKMFLEVTKQSQMSCIRLQGADMASLVVSTHIKFSPFKYISPLSWENNLEN